MGRALRSVLEYRFSTAWVWISSLLFYLLCDLGKLFNPLSKMGIIQRSPHLLLRMKWDINRLNRKWWLYLEHRIYSKKLVIIINIFGNIVNEGITSLIWEFSTHFLKYYSSLFFLIHFQTQHSLDPLKMFQIYYVTHYY